VTENTLETIQTLIEIGSPTRNATEAISLTVSLFDTDN